MTQSEYRALTAIIYMETTLSILALLIVALVVFYNSKKIKR